MTKPRLPRYGLVLLLAAIAASASCSAPAIPAPEASTPAAPAPAAATGTPEIPKVVHYGYEVVAAYPHDALAFTQGLAFDEGFLYEGTGLVGRSSLRRVELETGEVAATVPLPDDWFGEGIAVYSDRIVQLTWRNGVGRVYDRRDLRMLWDFAHEGEGWGVTYDGERLIVSDGTSTLRFLDLETFAAQGSVQVHDGGAAVQGLNELEFISGRVYANVWPTERIAVIDPADGHITGWVDCSGLLATRPVTGAVDVLNGIAWDEENERLFVTGKLWPWLFEIRLIPNFSPSAP